jgi:DNA polymerase-1
MRQISPAERTLTKQVCYALIYGAGPALVAQQAGVSEDAAQKMMEDFLRRYLGVKRFIAQTKAACRRCGYVETLLGRRLG